MLEVGHYIAAPFCTRILADLGAEVIKIEPPGGDPFRGWGAAMNGNSVWFSIHGRNKLSVELDLKRQRDTFLKLAARADVLVENLRAGPTGKARPGAGGAARRQSPPGDRAHLRLRPGRAVSRQAGLRRDRRGDGRVAPPDRASRPAPPTLPPPRCGISISDDLAGLYAAIGLLAALWQRDGAHTGVGAGSGEPAPDAAG